MCGVRVAYVFVASGCLCDVFLLCMWYMCCLFGESVCICCWCVR